MGIDRGPVPKHVAEKIDLPGLEDNVVSIVHYRDLLCTAQVIGDALKADRSDKIVSVFAWIIRLIIRVEKLMVVISKAQSHSDVLVDRKIAVTVQR